MKIKVLGSAAGGGFPQWNCGCANCNGVRSGADNFTARTQSSIAVSGNDATRWALINASPDILAQLRSCAALAPTARRQTPLAGIVLTDSQVDHATGLLMLRESIAPWKVWCTSGVYRDLTNEYPIFKMLERYCGIQHECIAPSEAFKIPNLSPLYFHALPIAGNAPPYSPRRDAPASGDVIALRIVDTDSGASICYAPALREIEGPIWRAMYASSCVLADGTFWTNDEMLAQGFSQRSAQDMGHLPQSGVGGMLECLAKLPATTRKILIHINNTNPILNEHSVERAVLNDCGIEVAYDGMEIEL